MGRLLRWLLLLRLLGRFGRASFLQWFGADRLLFACLTGCGWSGWRLLGASRAEHAILVGDKLGLESGLHLGLEFGEVRRVGERVRLARLVEQHVVLVESVALSCREEFRYLGL